MYWIQLSIFILNIFLIIPSEGSSCPDHCNCVNGSSVCDTCMQWYVNSTVNCSRFIRNGNLEEASIPSVLAKTSTTLLVTYKQDDMFEVLGLEEYYFYILQYSLISPITWENGTSSLSHVPDNKARTPRNVTIDNLQPNTQYQLKLVIYRQHNDITDKITNTTVRFTNTSCTDRLPPSGVYGELLGQNSVTVHWTNLNYNSSCDMVFIKLVYTTNSSSVMPGSHSLNNVKIENGTYAFTSLTAGTTYNMKIRINYTDVAQIVESSVFIIGVSLTTSTTQSTIQTTTSTNSFLTQPQPSTPTIMSSITTQPSTPTIMSSITPQPSTPTILSSIMPQSSTPTIMSSITSQPSTSTVNLSIQPSPSTTNSSIPPQSSTSTLSSSIQAQPSTSTITSTTLTQAPTSPSLSMALTPYLGTNTSPEAPTTTTHDATSLSTTTRASDIGLIAGVVTALLVIVLTILLVVLLVFFRRYRILKGENGFFKRNKTIIHDVSKLEIKVEKGVDGEDNEALEMMSENKPLTAATGNNLLRVGILPIDQEEQEITYRNLGSQNRPNISINVSDLNAYVQNNYSTNEDGNETSFHGEFKSLPDGAIATADVAGKSTVNHKNRYLNVHAYDHSRVHLDIIDDNEDTNYINANYITGYKGKEKCYVATQGPKTETYGDFWRMIWILNTNRIVMITGLIENGTRKCDMYWPWAVGDVEKYSYITVTSISVEIYADYTVRIFNIEKEGESEIRTIYHLQFNAWPDKSAPEQAFPILSFRRKVLNYGDGNQGPLVVHCSAGIGRTGTFIALDYLLQEGQAEGSVNIFEYVCLMRSARTKMVQTLPQYQFIHNALVDAFKTGTTAIPCEQFTSEYAQNNADKLTEQYSILDELTAISTPDDCAGNMQENRHRNRSQDIVPDDDARPHLIIYDGHQNDYINAVFVAGFKKHHSYIATQMPLESTVADFWKLIWDQSSKTIVMLNYINPDEQSEESNGAIYWPDDEDPIQQYGLIEVELVSENETPIVSVRVFKIKHTLKPAEPALTVKQFQFSHWSADSLVPTGPTHFIDLLELVAKWQQISGNKPIITHCMNGSTRSGLFCAASYMIDRLKEDQEVDVFTTVRYVRINRPQFIENIDQYVYLHELAAEYMSHYDTYANFK